MLTQCTELFLLYNICITLCQHPANIGLQSNNNHIYIEEMVQMINRRGIDVIIHFERAMANGVTTSFTNL